MVIKHLPAYKNAFRDYFHAGLQGKGIPSRANIPKKVSAYSNESEFAPSEMGQEATHLANTHLDSSRVTHTGSWREALTGAVSPELKMILEEAHAAGTHARHSLQAKAEAKGLKVDSSNPAVQMLGRKSSAIYARALKGDFVHLHDMAKKYPGMHDEIHSHLLEIEKKTHHPLTTILNNRSVAERVETAYKDNPITGKLFSSLADAPRDLSGATDNLHTRSKSLLAGAMGSGVIDPLAGLMNSAKVALSNKQTLAKSPKLKAFSDKVTEKVVVGPINAAADTGFVEARRHNPWYQRAKKYLANNAVGNFEDAVNSTAYAAGQHTRGIRKALAVGEDVQ